MADLFGGELLLPDGSDPCSGMTFSGTTSGGGTFSGAVRTGSATVIRKTDGFGFINAEGGESALR